MSERIFSVLAFGAVCGMTTAGVMLQQRTNEKFNTRLTALEERQSLWLQQIQQDHATKLSSTGGTLGWLFHLLHRHHQRTKIS